MNFKNNIVNFYGTFIHNNVCMSMSIIVFYYAVHYIKYIWGLYLHPARRRRTVFFCHGATKRQWYDVRLLALVCTRRKP